MSQVEDSCEDNIGDEGEFPSRRSSNSSSNTDSSSGSLPYTRAQLIQHGLLHHSDKEVRLLVCCCLVDVLRIFAPAAPYDEVELLEIFGAIISLLLGLATYDTCSGTGAKLLYILKSLSTVKSCVMLVYLAQNNFGNAQTLLMSLFEALVSSIRTEHSDEVGGHMGAVLQALIEVKRAQRGKLLSD